MDSKIIMKNKSGGFTFVELLVVITIMIMLTTVISASFSNAQMRSRDSKRKSDMNVMKAALEQYYQANNSSYPDVCSTASTFVQGSWPADPGVTSYSDSGAAACTTSTFCICATMEIAGSGNSNDASCGWGGAKGYYCVANSQ